MASGDVFQLTMRTDLSSADYALNIFHYQAIAGSGEQAADVRIEFDDTVIPLLVPLMAPSAIITSIQTINSNDNDDFDEHGVNIPGTNVVTARTPDSTVLAMRAPRLSLGQRYSYKRFSGLSLDMLGSTDGSWDEAAYADFVALGAALGAQLEGSEGSYVPVQTAGGFALGVPLVVNYPLQGQWSFNAFPSTQVTRKRFQWLSTA